MQFSRRDVAAAQICEFLTHNFVYCKDFWKLAKELLTAGEGIGMYLDLPDCD